MLQTHNEIVGFFFLFFVVTLRFFVFVSAFFSFCFVFFFFSQFLVPFQIQKRCRQLTHSRMWECTQSNIVFFLRKIRCYGYDHFETDVQRATARILAKISYSSILGVEITVFEVLELFVCTSTELKFL